MVLVNGYFESATANEKNHGTSANQADISSFVRRLHQLADGLVGELILVAIEQVPDQPKHLRIHRFAVGDSPGMREAAFDEAAKDWVNLYFGSYVVRKGLPPNSRGSHEDIIAVLMLGVDQDADTGREGALPLEPNLVVQTSQIPTINRQAFCVLDPQHRPTPEEAHG